MRRDVDVTACDADFDDEAQKLALVDIESVEDIGMRRAKSTTRWRRLLSLASPARER